MKLYGRNLNELKVLKIPYQKLSSQQPTHYLYGKGLGTFIRQAIGILSPLFKSGGKALLKEGFKAGADILSEMDDPKKQLSEVLKNRSQIGIQNLKEKAINTLRKNLQGSGIKRRKYTTKKNSVKGKKKKKSNIKLKVEKKSKKKTKNLSGKGLKRKAKKRKNNDNGLILGLIKRKKPAVKKKKSKGKKGKKQKFEDIFS